MTIEEFREKVKDEEYAPGWDAIEEAFAKCYPGQEPNHYGTNIEARAMFGGSEYIDGYSIYKSPHGHRHIVTFGMTELYVDEEAFGGKYSRWGYEMTFKLKADNDDDCMWAINFLGNLGRYTYTKESWFEPGHFMSNMGTPIKVGADSLITAILAVEDTEVPGIDTIYGRVDFLQFVGITSEEYEMLKADPTKVKPLVDAMKKDKNLTKEKAEEIWYSRANDGYCGGIDHQHYNATRYHGVNLHSFFTKGTVEFRLFNSTLHAGRIKAYIQFCLAMSAWAIESNDKIVFRSVSGYSADKKVTLMYHILTNRLGLYGDEFKTCRLHMMKQLKENATSAAA